jgi:amidase
MKTVSPFGSARDLAQAVRSRAISARELLDEYRRRIAAHNPALNAIVHLDWEAASESARRCDDMLDRGVAGGPLHGVPITVKEAFDVAGMPTTWGIPALRDNIAGTHSFAVSRLLEAGAVLMGKTNVPVLLADHQSFNAIHGRTNNPWNPERTPGGSSGGATAALAAGLTGFEIGSDIGGSIRQPAHCSGVYGHKPTFGIVPTVGHSLPGECAPLDMLVVGPLARSAADLELGLDLLAAPVPADAAAWRLDLPAPERRGLAEYRIGVMLDHPDAPVDAEVQEAIEALARFLEQRGAKVTRGVAPVAAMDRIFGMYVRLLRAATAAHLADRDFQAAVADTALLAPDQSGYVADTARGRAISHRDWLRLDEERCRLRAEWARFFESYDVLLCPAGCRTAAPHDTVSARHERRYVVNGRSEPSTNELFWAGLAGMVYLPGTVAPIATASDGLPVGVQIVGPWYRDRTTIAFARLLEQEYRGFVPPPGYG